jgi:hypothetical protein
MPDNQTPVACFAPPFSDDLLKTYEKLITDVKESELKDYLKSLYKCVNHWWGLPDSKETPVKKWAFKRSNGTDVIGHEQPLDTKIKEDLYEVTPWMRELLAMESIIGSIPNADKTLRDCAFHLLWACKELTLDREPMTIERLS